MKALPSIAFSGFRGTASEVTARQTGSRTVLSGRAQHSRVKTPKQSLRRASFSFITKQYRTLTEEQLAAWAALAAAHREQALIGDGAPLTGHNLFVCLNTNRSVLGVPLTKDAPVNIHGSHYIAYDDIWITPDKLLISGLRDPEYPNSQLVVRMAATESAAVTKAWGRTVITGTFHSSDWGDIDLTEIYTEQFGIPVTLGHKYFLEMYWIDEYSGYVSEISRVCAVAVESESVSGRDYVPRAVLQKKDVPDTDTSTAHAFDMEVSPGSKILSADMLLERTSGFSAGFAFPCRDIPDALDGTVCIMCSRGTADSDRPYAMAGMETLLAGYLYPDSVRISWRAGLFQSKAEVFGTAALFEF